MTKRSIESRIDSLEEQSTDRLTLAEFWERDICDDLEDPQESWEQCFQSGETE